MTKEERYKIACANFLAQHPDVVRELDGLSPNEARILGLSMEDFRKWKLDEQFALQAESQGIDPVEMAIGLAVESESERKAMLLERHREISEMLRIGWEEYCDLNPRVKEFE